MPGTPGARTGLAQILTGDPATQYRATINAIRDWAEMNGAAYDQGLLANRPVSTSADPGVAGRFYLANDVGTLYIDRGDAWAPVGHFGFTRVDDNAYRVDRELWIDGLLRLVSPDSDAGVVFGNYCTIYTDQDQPGADGVLRSYNSFALPIVTELPASPRDGQEIRLLVDATNGALWHLRYRLASASSFKWEFMGGSDMRAFTAAVGSTTSGTFGDLTGGGVGPALTVPVAGVYEFYIGAEGFNNTADGGFEMSYAIGAATPGSADRAVGHSSLANLPASIARWDRQTIATAATTVTAKYRRPVATGTANLQNRELRLRPVRVG